MGYHDDTCSAVVLHVWRDFTRADRDEAMKQVCLSVHLSCLSVS